MISSSSSCSEQEGGETSAQELESGSSAALDEPKFSERYGDGAERGGRSDRVGGGIKEVKLQRGHQREEKLPELDRDISVMEVHDVKLCHPQLRQDQRPTDSSQGEPAVE